MDGVGELVIEHRARKFGRSKYGGARFVKGFLDLLTVRFLTGFGQRPQHFLGALGIVSLLLGGAGLACLIVYWLLAHGSPDWDARRLDQLPLLLGSLGFLLFGGQMLSLGLLGELTVAYHDRAFRKYSISERTEAGVSASSADRALPADSRRP